MPTLTPLLADSLPPRVDVLFSAGELAPTVSTVTVLQISSAGQIAVRNATRVPAVGGIFVTDYEPPPGITVTYRAEQFNAAGVSLGLSGSADTQIDFPIDLICIQDPLAPKRFVLVDAPGDFAGQVSRGRSVSTYRAGGRTVALMGEVGLIEGVSIPVSTRSLVDADMLEDILSESPILVRTMPNIVRIPQQFFGVARRVSQVPVDVQYGREWIRWDITADQLSRPSMNIIESVVTYARFKAVYATYAAAKAVYATYLDAMRNPPPEA